MALVYKVSELIKDAEKMKKEEGCEHVYYDTVLNQFSDRVLEEVQKEEDIKPDEFPNIIIEF